MQKRMLYLSLICLVSLALCACVYGDVANDTIPPTNQTPTVETSVETTQSTTDPVVETTEATVPAHSELYLPEYTTEQIVEYFEEIVLHMEYTTGTGNTALVQKWNTPLRYHIYGNPTDEDIAVLNELFTQLNRIEGFPGIYAAADGEWDNLSISFLNPQGFSASFSDFLMGEDAYGATQFWYYTATNEIHTAKIGYRTDIDQTIRNSILLEEVINMLGTSDTVLRPDSIVYQYSNDNMTLSDVDWVIMKLLYNPAIQCGMNFEDCRTIIQELYY